MFDGKLKHFNVPFNTTEFGCSMLLRGIPIEDHLSPTEMDQLLFMQYSNIDQFYSRLSTHIVGCPNGTLLLRDINTTSISTAGPTTVLTLP